MSRAQSKVQRLGIELLAPDAIRQVVCQNQLGEEEINGRLAAGDLTVLRLGSKLQQVNGTWLLEDCHEFILDLPQLVADHTDFNSIVLRHCTHFRITASDVDLIIPETCDDKHLLLLDQCNNFVLQDLNVQGSRNPVVLNHCSRFRIERLIIRQAKGYGLTLLRCHAGMVHDSGFFACLASGINIVGQSRELHIQQCQIAGSTGPYNWDAGINCMHCSQAVTLQHVPESSHEALDLRDKLDTPHCIWIDACEISHCRAQGIYLEGAAQLLIEGCLIHDNNKEGICFDWGTAFSHLRCCQLTRNGERAQYDEQMCAIDFLPTRFRDRDGRHYCQLPGVSIDNGYLNTIERNLICANYGGGIKIVRSAFKNIIQFNILGANLNHLALSNDAILSDNPYRTSEIKILNMGAGDQKEFHPERALLDFLPPQGNQIRENQTLLARGGRNNVLHCWNAEEAMRNNQIDM